MVFNESLSDTRQGPHKKTDDMAHMTDLERENEALRKQLENVLATASSNEKIWRHFTEIERILFRTRDLDQLVEELLQEIKTRFRPDQVIIFLSHPDILERFFPDISPEDEPVGEGTWILPLPLEASSAVYDSTPRPLLLSSSSPAGLPSFLPPAAASVRSAVLIPLSIHQMLFGSLFFGSMDANRYQVNDGTELLEQLGIKIALCMDNCLTYEKVKEFTVMDPLTGLMNFFQIHTILEREFRKARRSQRPFSIMIVDLNFFHEADSYSENGSGVLSHVAALLRETLPKDESYLGRYGSDEFLVLLPDVPEEEAREVVPYLNQVIFKAPYKHQNTAILIQSIIGIGTLKQHMKRPQELLDSACMELRRLKTHNPKPNN